MREVPSRGRVKGRKGRPGRGEGTREGTGGERFQAG